MKKLELRQIIKEEIQKLLKEETKADKNKNIKNKYVVYKGKDEFGDDNYVIDKKKALEYLSQFDGKSVKSKTYIRDDEGWGEFEQYIDDKERLTDKQLEKEMRQDMSMYFFSDEYTIDDKDYI